MSETGSQNTLVPVVPQGRMEIAATSEQAQGGLPSYEELFNFYIAVKKQAGRTAPPLIPYEELQDFYITHGGGQSSVPQLSAPADAVIAIVVEDDVVTREEAQQAFHVVKDNFATMSDEHARMKQGPHGLASEIDVVRGKTAEDM